MSREILEKIGIERTWLKFEVAKALQVQGVSHLQLSSRTQAYIAAINNDICKLRELIDRDWEAQRKTLACRMK